jgi:glycosyltransferase involved in cell wall biosynthesis
LTSAPVRVLHLGKFYPPHAGGVERHVRDLARAQVAAGHEVAVLAHATPGVKPPSREDDAGVRVVRVPCHGQFVFVPVSPAWPLKFHAMLRDFRPDLLHVHVPNPSAFWALASPAARRLPWIVHWHADIPEDSRHVGLRLAYPPYRGFERALNRRARRIVATSSAYLDASRALRPVRDRCEVIPLGLGDAPAPGTPPAWPGAGLRVLAVGRLSYYKGFDVLVRAIARCADATLVIIGHGEQRARLEALVDALGVRERVRLAGNLGDADLEAAYRACDLFCLPSLDRAEAFGLVLLEAMRAGRAVLASDIAGSGVGTVVREGETGMLVPPGDVEALATALRALHADPERRARLGSAGKHRFDREYRIEAVTQAWDRTYRDVLAAPTAG